MAVKAVILQLQGDKDSGDVLRYTVADGTAISKGTLCVIGGDNTAVASSGNGESFLGIANDDKKANDGSTTLGLVTKCIADIQTIANLEIQAGDLVTVSGADLIRVAISSDLISGAVIGKALETPTTEEIISVQIGGQF